MKVINKQPRLAVYLLFICALTVLPRAGQSQINSKQLDIPAYLQLAKKGDIYPNAAQLEMLDAVLPKTAFQPAPSFQNRKYWQKMADTDLGKKYILEAEEAIGQAPEVPISDAIYRRANKEGNRGIYKPRYYRTMDRLEKYILAECMLNDGRYLAQIETYIEAIMEMKSWLHPNHDDSDNSVLEGKRVSIDLGARKFGLVLALADALLENKLSTTLRNEIAEQLQWRIIDTYLASCKEDDPESNHWIRSTSNWNSVCTSGTLFTTMVISDDEEERKAAIGAALNSMVFYLSGFGEDGYCSEGTGYWNYGFGHYLYLAEILFDYSGGKIDLFRFDNPEKLQKVADFPENFQVHQGLYAPFSDGVTRVKEGGDNFAYVMSAKYYGAQKPKGFVPDEAVQSLVVWPDYQQYISNEKGKNPLPPVTYFDDYGIVISRGQQTTPFSIAVKAGHNAENHNHSDVGSYVIAYGEQIMAGDIGAPSYIAGAFSKDNPARSSWGHPVPKINDQLQSNGREYKGRITSTEFTKNKDKVEVDIQPAYEIPSLTSLSRTVENDKTGQGTISITDHFAASRPVDFGVAIMTLAEYEIVDSRTVIITENGYKIKAEITGEGGDLVIKDEQVPVEHLREGGPAYRIGVDYTAPVAEGSITVRYSPLQE
ncbi:hypothetical protein DN752_23080 [Echinicola strongylocentroti]|uniref:Heparinase n=1 Tax=Echinicola strongylocentroti TaxID=1795355 RepID=A0A2Z4IR69_9BACT|nr:heparinase II/III family protein [Echinicola strongylocentroti]AWW32793.1 hypothetical protein DN752_23080 [Echinicola strongylocentroti]